MCMYQTTSLRYLFNVFQKICEHICFVNAYQQNTNLISESITTLATLKKMGTSGNFFTASRQGLKQQNSFINRSFVQNPDGLLNFFCERNTKLK